MPRRCSPRTALGFVLVASLTGACAPISVPQERQLGAEFERQIRMEVPLLRDRVVNDYLTEMGDAIVAAAGPQPFDYTFNVVVSDDINAFAGPAGHIYLHTKIFLEARNAAELAGVLAHEIGHVAKRHVASNYNRQRNTRIGQNILVLGASVVAGGAAGQLANFGTALAAAAYLNDFGRDAELEADAFAVEVLPRIGLDPIGLVTFFETLMREAPDVPSGLRFLSSHPATEDRIAAARAAIAEVRRSGLQVDDGGRFEIVQRRIELLTRGRR